VVEFTEVETPASASQIHAFEARVGCRFPPRLMRLFLETNGGRPSHNFYGDGGNAREVFHCLPLREGRNSVQHIYEILVHRKRLFPAHFVPFAVDPGGDTFFIDCDSPNGLVYLFDHEDVDNYCKPLNVTIDEFFDKLTDGE